MLMITREGQQICRDWIEISIDQNKANLENLESYFDPEWSESEDFRTWIMDVGHEFWLQNNFDYVIEMYAKEIGNENDWNPQGEEWEWATFFSKEDLKNIVVFARKLWDLETTHDMWDNFSRNNDLCLEYYKMQLENKFESLKGYPVESRKKVEFKAEKTKVLETIVDTYNIDNEQRKGENENSHSS